MDLGIKNKFCLVTGGGKNIGKAIATELAKEGVRVLIIGRDKKSLINTTDYLNSLSNLNHLYFKCDVTKDVHIFKLKEFIHNNFGKIELVVHNIGGSLGISNPVANYEDWLNVWDLNLGSVIKLNNFLIPILEKNNWGRIVHISTISTFNFDGNPAYVSSKCALNGYVRSLAKYYAKKNIIISAVAAGAMKVEGRHYTKMIRENPEVLEEFFRNKLPIGRLSELDELSPSVAFLCSKHASFAAGSIFPISGGAI